MAATPERLEQMKRYRRRTAGGRTLPPEVIMRGRSKGGRSSAKRFNAKEWQKRIPMVEKQDG